MHVVLLVWLIVMAPAVTLAAAPDPACLGCHATEQLSGIGTTLGSSVHAGLGCTDCHAAAAETPHPLPLARVNCSTCHTDIAAEHAAGAHRIGREATTSYPTNCTACHGGHTIRPPADPSSPTHHQNIPETCKTCHLGVYTNFVRSAHGALWKAGDARGPVCTTCHTAHKIRGVASAEFRLATAQECGTCHEHEAPSYRDTFHGQATAIGFVFAAKCSDCHTAHLNLPKDDPDASIHPSRLLETCGQCHPKANPQFVAYDPHPHPGDKGKSAPLFYVTQFMVWLLMAVFTFFGIHTLLWFQRTMVAVYRGELHRHWHGEQYIQRFDRSQRLTHVAVVVSFLGLALTGILLKYHDAPWAPFLNLVFGGVEVARYFHRVCAIITAGYAAYHLAYLARQVLRGDTVAGRGLRDTIIPQWKDITDLFGNLRWFLYLGDRPKIGRYAYWEKFDYFAIFWGVPVIGFSGLILWFPEFFTQWLPGLALNIAMVIHGEEALLAMGFIFLFHFFHAHLRPENFPLDPVIFTGRIPVERYREERPDEYEALVASGRLHERLVGPPTLVVRRFALVFGYGALATGIAIILAIFAAYLL